MGTTNSPVTTRVAGTLAAELTAHGHDVTDDEAHQLAHDIVERLTILRLIEASSVGEEAARTAGGDVVRARQRHYISTACLHFKHEACRRQCKFCEQTCRCPCHLDQPPHEPATERFTLTAGDNSAANRLPNLNIDEALAIARYFLYRGDVVVLEEDSGG